MSDDAEPDFQSHLTETNEAIDNALNELANVRAYTLKPKELIEFKAAQYGLRYVSQSKGMKNRARDAYDVDGPPIGDGETR